MFETRSSEIEIMDDLSIQGQVIDQTLKELDIINRRLGGNQISLSIFKKLLDQFEIKTVADLGCGGGDILIDMAKVANRKQQVLNFNGIDANPHIVNYAEKHTAAWPNIAFQAENIFSEDFQKRKFDLIHCCLFLHHFTNRELIELFKKLKQQAKVAIIVNDLQRHWLAYYSIKLITQFFSKSFMVKNDAAVSVARGFRKSELIDILEQAEISNFQIKWKWAFRWQLVIMI